MSYAQEFINQN